MVTRDNLLGTRGLMVVGLVAGLALGCAGKHKKTQSPAECMNTCEQDQCSYNADATDNDEYLECLEACQDSCG
ncbi:MAG: hypothetical protein K0V04_11855 [Deltaproteobacteria bacterium]|nr:hypothetical protein [Deltaproteobacteria bacterium]